MASIYAYGQKGIIAADLAGPEAGRSFGDWLKLKKHRPLLKGGAMNVVALDCWLRHLPQCRLELSVCLGNSLSDRFGLLDGFNKHGSWTDFLEDLKVVRLIIY